MENYRLLTFIVIALFAVPTFVSAYSVATHQELHKNILKEYRRLAGNDIQPVLERAFIKGAVDEDKGMRPVNHFYDPINNVGLKNNTRPKSILWATNPYLQGTFGEWRLAKDKDTRLLEHNNDYSWQRAVYEYVHGDKERAMESLGHNMHLLEDLTSVPHARDDAHSGSWFDGRSYYEDYTVDKVPSVELDGILYKDDIKEVFKDLSTYTNTHYLSKDTVFKKYHIPTLLVKDGNDDYAYNNDGAKLVLVEYKENKKGQRQLDKVILNDPQVMQSYWEHLSYRAVESGVALMSLFFREVERERQTGELAYMNKSYSEIKSIAASIKGFGAMKALLGSSLTAIDAYDLNEEEWEGARRAAELYGIEFPKRPTRESLLNGQAASAAAVFDSGNTPDADLIEVTLISGPQGPEIVTSTPLEATLAQVDEPAPPPVSEQVPDPEPSVSKPDLVIIPETAPIIELPVTPDPAPIVPPAIPAPKVVLSPSLPQSNPSPFEPGGFAFGGGGGGGAAPAPKPEPEPEPVDTTPPDIELSVDGCYNFTEGECRAYPGVGLTYNWSTSATDLKEFTIDDGVDSVINSDASGSATVTLGVDGDTQIINITAVDNEGNSAMSTLTLSAQVPSIIINEVAWGGTKASATDEWFELYNNENFDVDLSGMSFVLGNDELVVPLSGIIAPSDYFLVESSEEATSVPADLVTTFTTEMSDFGAPIKLKVGTTVIEEVPTNDSGRWFEGYSNPGDVTNTMERFLTDGDSSDASNWASPSKYMTLAQDRNGEDMRGTPGARNSINYRLTYNNTLTENETTIDATRSPYIIEYMSIPSGKKLTLEPGVVIEFYTDYTNGGLWVKGELVVKGTEAKPVEFKAHESGGRWQGLVLTGADSKINLNYLNIKDTGSSTAWNSSALLIEEGSAQLKRVTIDGSASSGIYANQDANINISNSSIINNATYGILVDGSTLTLDNSTISDNQDGLYISGLSGSSVTNTSFNNNSNIALLHEGVNDVIYTNLSGSGNGVDGIFLSGLWMSPTGETALLDAGLPYVLSGLTIKDNTTLSVVEGVTIKGTADGSRFGKSKILIKDNGVLSLWGTESSPVVFTSLNDPDNSPVDGDWWGIELEGAAAIVGGDATTAQIKYADQTIPLPW